MFTVKLKQPESNLITQILSHITGEFSEFKRFRDGCQISFQISSRLQGCNSIGTNTKQEVRRFSHVRRISCEAVRTITGIEGS